jgi:hypothetical protein
MDLRIEGEPLLIYFSLLIDKKYLAIEFEERGDRGEEATFNNQKYLLSLENPYAPEMHSHNLPHLQRDQIDK